MGATQSCASPPPVEKEEISAIPSVAYNLSFVCSTLPTFGEKTPIESILYAENWCSSEFLWKTYLNNAFKELYAEKNEAKSTRISRLKIYTRVNGDLIIGNVKWISKDVDIHLLNQKIKIEDENFFERGMYFIEAFWTTTIIPYNVSKAPIVHIN